MGWEMRKDSEIEPRMVMGMEGEEEEEEAEEEEEEEEEEILILDLKDAWPILRKYAQQTSAEMAVIRDEDVKKQLKVGLFLTFLDPNSGHEHMTKNEIDYYLEQKFGPASSYPLRYDVHKFKFLILHNETGEGSQNFRIVDNDSRKMFTDFVYIWGMNKKRVNRRLICMLNDCEVYINPSGKLKDEKRNHLRAKHNVMDSTAYKEIRLQIYYDGEELGVISNLRTFVNNIIPIARKRQRELNFKREEELTNLGWYFCFVRNCENNLLRTKSEHFEHIEQCHGMGEEAIEEQTKETRIVIMHQEPGKCEYEPDTDPKELLSPLIKLFKEWVKKQSQTDYPKDEDALNKVHLKAGYLCLLKDCGCGKISDGTNFRNEVRTHAREKHAGQNGQIFSIRLTYEKTTDIEIREGSKAEMELAEIAAPNETEQHCSLCKCKFYALRRFACKDHKDHDQEKWSENFKCQICAKTFRRISVNEIMRYKREMNHSRTYRFCQLCMKDFDYDEHLRKFHQ